MSWRTKLCTVRKMKTGLLLRDFGSKPLFGVHHKHQPLHDRINPKDCQVKKPLVIQGFSNSLGLFQVIMANPVVAQDSKSKTASR